MAWPRAKLSDVMGQRVIYRNLAPVMPGLAGLEDLWREVGLDRFLIPRKTSMEYARIVWLILQDAQRLRGEVHPLERVLLIGDSARNDGAVARNMGQEHPSRAFIGLDALAEPRRVQTDEDTMTANRWDALVEMLAWLDSSGFACDERTAVLVDIDKTIIGARGRNDRIIDLARVRAAERTAAGALGADLNVQNFRDLYARLNRSESHWLTEDNQDYVAYLSVLVAGGICPEKTFWEMMSEKRFADILGFCDWCESHAERMPAGLLAAHREVREGLAQQDPTPFKSFRRDEFRETIALMDVLPDDADASLVLNSEIVITAEVLDVCRTLSDRGALVFGLSDKPDEASLPSPEAAAQGLRAIHDTTIKIYGERLF